MKSVIVFILAVTVFTSLAHAEAPNWQLRGGELMSDRDYSHGKFEVRMYSQEVIGTTSTFFLWHANGWQCGTQWNEIDIETIPREGRYQSNPIWQTSNADCSGPQRDEGLHGSSSEIYDRWVTFILEWTPDYIRWARIDANGNEIQDRRISRFTSSGNEYHPSVQYLQRRMKFAFNIWSQGVSNPYWLGNLDMNAIRSEPVFQFVDYVKIYNWNGSSFSASPNETFEFNSESEIAEWRKGDWNFEESQGYVRWSPNAIGIADLGNGNKALWLGLFHKDHMREPFSHEIPADTAGGAGSLSSGNGCSFNNDTTYGFRNQGSGRYMDVSAVSKANGANIHQWGTSVSNGDHRRFTAVSQGGGWYGLRAVHSNKFLNVARAYTWNGANVIQWGNSGHYTNSQFRAEPAPNGGCQVRIRHSNKCLTVANLSTSNGGNIEQYECVGSSGQAFDIQPQ